MYKTTIYLKGEPVQSTDTKTIRDAKAYIEAYAQSDKVNAFVAQVVDRKGEEKFISRWINNRP